MSARRGRAVGLDLHAMIQINHACGFATQLCRWRIAKARNFEIGVQAEGTQVPHVNVLTAQCTL